MPTAAAEIPRLRRIGSRAPADAALHVREREEPVERLALGASVTLLAQLLKLAGVADQPWKTVVAALASAFALTALLALSAGLLAIENLYGLVAGAIVATAAAVGIRAACARERGASPGPHPATASSLWASGLLLWHLALDGHRDDSRPRRQRLDDV